MIRNYGYQLNRSLLKLYDKYEAYVDKNVEAFQYCTKEKELSDLKEKYDIEKVAGSNDELSKVLNLLDWISTSIHHEGSISKNIEMNSMELLRYCFEKGKSNGINCRMKATILTEMLLSIGIISRIVSLHPLNPGDMDNHVVSQVWLNEKSKWIIVDPTTNSYFKNHNGELLNAIELREAIISEEEIVCNPKTNFGGKLDNYEAYLTYMAKNLFYMHSPLVNGFGSEMKKHQKWIALIPKDFNGRKREEDSWTLREENLKRENLWTKDMEQIIETRKKRSINEDMIYTSSVKSFMMPIVDLTSR